METPENNPPEEVIMSITALGEIKTQEEEHIQPTESTDQILFVRVSTDGTDGIMAHTLAIEALQRNATLRQVAEVLKKAGIDIIEFEEQS